MNNILTIGIILLFGFLAGKLLAKLKVPAVTGYILIGIAIGVSFLHLIPEEVNTKLDWMIEFALIIVAFSIGGELKKETMRKYGKKLLTIVVFETLFAYIFILFFLLLFKVSFPIALLIAALGSATAPAVTVLVLDELKAKGPLSMTLLACVGLDDALGLTLYAISSSIVHSIIGTEHILVVIIILKILISIFASIIIGIIAAYLLNIIFKIVRFRMEVLTVSLGMMTFFPGLLEYKIWDIRFSPLLASMAMGFVISNFSRHRREIFTALDNFSYPFYIIYFVLAGARLRVAKLIKLGFVALAYLIGRFSGKILGAYAGALLSKSSPVVRKYTGFGLFSQAGIAIGLCLIAAKEFPQFSQEIVAIALGTTIITEIIGPFSTKLAITKSGEAGKNRK
ncbi:MAG: hypothetical protein B5M53_01960 [Candidatus Cloacimonas sp. 4484_209]|nr:MAG: hypothetical protein B5M53_01960 [Candidatus Cloacimonas sp. 4484_209]